MMGENQFPHANRRNSGSTPIAPAIELSTVWEMESIEQADSILSGSEHGFAYRRDGHPNASQLTSLLNRMHGAECGVVTAQGNSALATACLALLSPGDLVILGTPLYGKSELLIREEFARWGIRTETVDACDLNAWKTAMRNRPRLAVFETITNPRLTVPAIEDIANLAHQNLDSQTLVLVDNTFATASLCQPLNLGADLVFESLTKFSSGHGDAMLGYLGGYSKDWSRVQRVVSTFGFASSPMDCWLAMRGLATLDIRMEKAANTALEIAQALSDHPRLASIDYPGLQSSASYPTAKAQFHGRYGNMITLHLQGGIPAANAFIQAIKQIIPFCPSLGDVRSTLSHPLSTSHRSYSEKQLADLGIDGGTLRFSIGLEPANYLLSNIAQALDSLP